MYLVHRVLALQQVELKIVCFRICYVDDVLIPKKHYDSCSKNDVKLFNYVKSVASVGFWNNSKVFSKNGIPGIASGIFGGN